MAGETLKEYELTTNTWIKPDLFPGELITIKNIGATPISIYITETEDTITDSYLEQKGIDPIEIGGLTYELSTNSPLEKLWVKAINGSGLLSIRIKGTLDPSEDITYLAGSLNKLIVDVNNHKADTHNPHGVTSDQVGLGNIPNAISDTPTDNKSDVLATTKATNVIVTDLTDHKADTHNPHGVTSDQVGLGQVPNFPKATEITAVDTTNDQALMTPAMSYLALKSWIEMTMSVRAQIAVQGLVGSRILGWSTKDCSATSLIVEKVTDKSYKINAGLQVSFADNGKTRISTTSTTTTTLNIPSEVTSTATYYPYVDIDSKGNLTEFAHTTTQPYEGMERRFYVGDFWNVAQNVMYDKNNNVIRRVYLGKIYVVSGKISSVIPIPVGYEYEQPLTQSVLLGGRYLVDSPFIGPSRTEAEVEYNFNWGPSYWNDQIGVIASPYPNDPINKCIVQCGQMGFLASGKESGSPFGASFEAITDALRVRVRFTKKY